MTLAVDGYVTRVTSPPIIIDRPDPVVWSRSGDPEVQRFAERGYVQREGAMDAGRVDACLEELHRIGADPAMAADPRVIREAGSDAVRSIFDVHTLSEGVWEAVEHSGAVDLARDRVEAFDLRVVAAFTSEVAGDELDEAADRRQG